MNRVYPPELAATGQLLADLAEALAVRGWSVTVVTSRGTSSPATEELRGVKICRVSGFSFDRSTTWKRALCYLSLYPAFLWRALREPKPNIVVTMTDPPLHLGLGVALKWFRGARVVHWAQDLYPELAEEFGVLKKNGLFARLLRAFSTFCLRRQDVVVAVGECMKEKIKTRGLPENRIRIVQNWALAALGMAGDEGAFRATYGLENRFVVMYSGNLGLAHSFAEIIAAVKTIGVADPEVVFAFVGDGPRLADVRKELAGQGNVRFISFQKQEALSASLGAADLHLVSISREAAGLIVPSKVYGVLAAGKPVLLIGPPQSEAARLIERHQCGLNIGSGRSEALAEAILKARRNPVLLESWNRGAQKAESEIHFTSALPKFLLLFENLLAPH